jgi:hypothetical protein
MNPGSEVSLEKTSPRINKSPSEIQMKRSSKDLKFQINVLVDAKVEASNLI